jgi:glycosyltransferase involved in cell wall biosynthesis
VDIITFLLENPLFFLLIAFGLAFLVQLFFYSFYYFRILFYKNKAILNKNKDGVSVIICAKNEQENLEKFLPSILEQNYPNYEVIVVDDCSEDETEFVIQRLQKKYKHLKSTTIKKDDKFYHSKKLALTVGIKAASNDILLFTDADCKAESPKWIEKMQQNFTKETDIVLSYGGYFSERKIINNLIRFDTLFIALQYLTFALARKTYMGVGRNLAYRKTLFFKNKGFASHYHIESGDDDLFISQAANKTNVSVEISRESITRSQAEISFSNWFQQKKRHLSTGKLYKFKTKWRLFCENISRIGFYVLFILSLIFFKEYYIYITAIFAFRMILQLIVYKVAMKRLNEKFLLLPSLLYDILIPFFNLSFLLINNLSRKKNKWK